MNGPRPAVLIALAMLPRGLPNFIIAFDLLAKPSNTVNGVSASCPLTQLIAPENILPIAEPTPPTACPTIAAVNISQAAAIAIIPPASPSIFLIPSSSLNLFNTSIIACNGDIRPLAILSIADTFTSGNLLNIHATTQITPAISIIPTAPSSNPTGVNNIASPPITAIGIENMNIARAALKAQSSGGERKSLGRTLKIQAVANIPMATAATPSRPSKSPFIPTSLATPAITAKPILNTANASPEFHDHSCGGDTNSLGSNCIIQAAATIPNAIIGIARAAANRPLAPNPLTLCAIKAKDAENTNKAKPTSSDHFQGGATNLLGSKCIAQAAATIPSASAPITNGNSATMPTPFRFISIPPAFIPFISNAAAIPRGIIITEIASAVINVSAVIGLVKLKIQELATIPAAIPTIINGIIATIPTPFISIDTPPFFIAFISFAAAIARGTITTAIASAVINVTIDIGLTKLNTQEDSAIAVAIPTIVKTIIPADFKISLSPTPVSLPVRDSPASLVIEADILEKTGAKIAKTAAIAREDIS